LWQWHRLRWGRGVHLVRDSLKHHTAFLFDEMARWIGLLITEVNRPMNPSHQQDKPVIYEIRVKGILDEQWSSWLGGLTIVPQVSGETLLTGPVRDQAALHGLIIKIRDMGLPLLSIKRMDVV
jgi:hypothetical protein